MKITKTHTSHFAAALRIIAMDEQKRDEQGRFASSRELAKVIGAPPHASLHEEGGEFGKGGVSFMRSGETHKEAHARITAAGFQKKNSMRSTQKHKSGRTAAYTRTKEQVSEYTHPHGHIARIKTRLHSESNQPNTYWDIHRFA